MLPFLLLSLLLTFSHQDEEVTDRLGLIGTDLGLSPLGSDDMNKEKEDEEDFYNYDYYYEGGNAEVSNPALLSLNDPTEIHGNSNETSREESVEEDDFSNFLDKLTNVPASILDLEQCCCLSPAGSCPKPEDIDNKADLLAVGLIESEEEDISDISDTSNNLLFSRSGLGTITAPPSVIVKPGVCPPQLLACCYPPSINISTVIVDCLSPAKAQQVQSDIVPSWQQGCPEKIPVARSRTKECGTRIFQDIEESESWPGEFPWTCLVLTLDDGYIGTCAIIPSSSGQGNTKKVVTAAHKLNNLSADRLKVRVGEHDANGFNWPNETENYQEHKVRRVFKHNNFNKKRLDYDIAVLLLEREVDLAHPMVNTACLPSCREQFSHQFPNGSGLICWTSGWGKDGKGKFKSVMQKVSVTLVNETTCKGHLKPALDSISPGLGASFNLSSSEICATNSDDGTIESCGEGKPEGGSPLVCQAQSGRWTLVGLVTWATSECSVPGVNVRLESFTKWIESLVLF